MTILCLVRANRVMKTLSFSLFSTLFYLPLCSCFLFPTKSLPRSYLSFKRLSSSALSIHPISEKTSPRPFSDQSYLEAAPMCPPSMLLASSNPARTSSLDIQIGIDNGGHSGCLGPYESGVTYLKYHSLSKLFVFYIIASIVIMPPMQTVSFLRTDTLQYSAQSFTRQEGQNLFLLTNPTKMIVEARLNQYGIGNRTEFQKNCIFLFLW